MIESFKINCFKLNRSIRVTINLPDNYYNNNRYYPAVYFLDGQNLYNEQEAYTKTALHLEKMIPDLQAQDKEAIYIGIWAASHEERRKIEYEQTDLADFIIDQIHPFLSDRYRLNHFQYIFASGAASYTALKLSENKLYKGVLLYLPQISKDQLSIIEYSQDKLYYFITNTLDEYLDIKEKVPDLQLIIQEKTDDYNRENITKALNYIVL